MFQWITKYNLDQKSLVHENWDYCLHELYTTNDVRIKSSWLYSGLSFSFSTNFLCSLHFGITHELFSISIHSTLWLLSFSLRQFIRVHEFTVTMNASTYVVYVCMAEYVNTCSLNFRHRKCITSHHHSSRAIKLFRKIPFSVSNE